MIDQLINFAAIEQASLKLEPFPYVVIPHFLKTDYLPSLIENFPTITHRGSIPASSINQQSLFDQLIKELNGAELKQIIANKFTMDLETKPSMLTLRGNTTERDGVIHTDSKSKLITLLLYMNPSWESEGGKLRLLKNKHSLDDYVEEISPLAGSCVIFKVTPNCWHGHKPFVGKRLSLQLNYLAGEAALVKHQNHHRFTAWLKRLLPRIFHHNNENY
jgi:SM-20-related protein